MFQVTFERAALKQGLETVQAAYSKGSSLPILQCVLLETGEAGAESFAQVTATDLLLSLQAPVKAEVGVAGAAAVHFATLYALVTRLSDERLTLTVEADAPKVCKVVSESFTGTLMATMADEFPRVNFGQEGEYGAALKLELTRDAVKLIRRAVVPFAGVKDFRETLNFTQWRMEVENLFVAAADGFRLAKLRVVDCEVSERENFDGEAFLVMPRFIAKLDVDEVEQVTLWFYPTRNEIGDIEAGGYVTAQVGSVWLRGALGDGKFPEIEAIAASVKGALHVTAQVAACKYALGLTGIYGSKVQLELNTAAQTLLVQSAVTVEQGGCVIPLPVQARANDDAELPEMFEIAFNALFLRDVLNALQGDEVVFELDAPAAPARFSSRTFMALVMPLSLARDEVAPPAASATPGEVLAEAEAIAEEAFERADEIPPFEAETFAVETVGAEMVEAPAPEPKRRGKRGKKNS